jgi:hypothetical protein
VPVVLLYVFVACTRKPLPFLCMYVCMYVCMYEYVYMFALCTACV